MWPVVIHPLYFAQSSAVTRLPIVVFVLIAILCTGCQSSAPTVSSDRVGTLRARVDSLRTANERLSYRSALRNPNLHSTLWAQTAVEYAGVTRQAYALAEIQMKRALRDSSWTASTAQAANDPAAYRGKPPAVVLDVDETVLDNSPYQARLVLDNERYRSESWKEWTREEKAGIVPGALRFTRTAVRNGVQVIYLTNRDSDVEASTRANLEALGFPIEDEPDAVLTQYEREGWGPKQARREWVAKRYRILLLIGDNFGDFTASVDTTVAARRSRARAYDRYWGTRWIVLPNAQYGSWEGALYDFNYERSALEILEEKHEALKPKRPGGPGANTDDSG